MTVTKQPAIRWLVLFGVGVGVDVGGESAAGSGLRGETIAASKSIVANRLRFRSLARPCSLKTSEAY